MRRLLLLLALSFGCSSSHTSTSCDASVPALDGDRCRGNEAATLALSLGTGTDRPPAHTISGASSGRGIYALVQVERDAMVLYRAEQGLLQGLGVYPRDARLLGGEHVAVGSATDNELAVYGIRNSPVVRMETEVRLDPVALTSAGVLAIYGVGEDRRYAIFGVADDGRARRTSAATALPEGARFHERPAGAPLVSWIEGDALLVHDLGTDAVRVLSTAECATGVERPDYDVASGEGGLAWVYRCPGEAGDLFLRAESRDGALLVVSTANPSRNGDLGRSVSLSFGPDDEISVAAIVDGRPTVTRLDHDRTRTWILGDPWPTSHVLPVHEIGTPLISLDGSTSLLVRYGIPDGEATVIDREVCPSSI